MMPTPIPLTVLPPLLTEPWTAQPAVRAGRHAADAHAADARPTALTRSLATDEPPQPPGAPDGEDQPSPRPWRVAAWVGPEDVAPLVAALGPTAVVVVCDSLDALATALGDGVAAAVVQWGRVADADLEAVAALAVNAPTTVFAGLAWHPMADDGSGAHLSVIWEQARSARWGGDMRAFLRPSQGPSDGAAMEAEVAECPPADWDAFARSLAAARLPDPVQRACVAAVLGDVWGPRRTGWGGAAEATFADGVAALFSPGVTTVRDIATRIGGDAAALEAQFARLGLPEVGRYVAAARLVRSAWNGEPAAADAIATVVRPAAPDAPARLHRMVRRLRRLASLAANVSPVGGAGPTALRAFRVALVVPFRDALAASDPAGRTAP